MLATTAHVDRCSGKLTDNHGELVLTGKNQGICIIGKSRRAQGSGGMFTWAYLRGRAQSIIAKMRRNAWR
jgi:hypothetical protein